MAMDHSKFFGKTKFNKLIYLIFIIHANVNYGLPEFTLD